MNLKESFRYQKFLDSLIGHAASSVTNRGRALKVTKKHLRKLANLEAEDKTEEIITEEFIPNDDVLTFMQFLIEEKESLSIAIGKAKVACEIDIDAAVETNKFRQLFHKTIDSMLRHTASVRTERGCDYKFNVEGNQIQYSYDVEVIAEEAYNRESAKRTMKSAITKADEVSRRIDAALVNTEVEYTAPFDVNDSFEDAVSTFLAN